MRTSVSLVGVRLLLALLSLQAGAGLALAQDASSEAPAATVEGTNVQRVFQVRWADMQDVELILNNEAGLEVLVINRRARTVQVEARPEIVSRIETWLQQVDVPPHVAVVRIILEKAERSRPVGGDDLVAQVDSWTRSTLAETTFEVHERGEHRQAFGPDGAYEIHVSLGSVDPDRRLMHFDRFAVSHLRPDPSAPEGARGEDLLLRRELLATSIDLRDRTGRTVMAASDSSADQALVVRAVGLIRESEWERR